MIEVGIECEIDINMALKGLRNNDIAVEDHLDLEYD